jgi:DNA-binding IclR family transcriptional regulator
MNSPERDQLPIIVDAAPAASTLVKSAGRVLQIFEFFDEIQREARVAEIAERLHFPQSSTSVLLKCLTQLGYLDFDADSRTFLPSARVALLGAWLD